VDLARFERATSTFAESRSDSTELRVLSISDCGFRIADLRGSRQSAFCIPQSSMVWRRRSESNAHRISPGRLATCCHTVRRRLQIGGRLGSRTLHGLSRHSFQDCLTRSSVGPSLRNWQGRSDLNRESRFWKPMVCPVSLHPLRAFSIFDLFVSRLLVAIETTRKLAISNLKFQIIDFKFQI
jgi:hypothetical protein